ncbi:hypothetical protein [Rhizobium sp. EC-SD404]|uniref:hypothetical protein n=1 Tax=Rhizobium sp. EC-SD404 TaxID=2038389 RepID=UPI001251E6F4|nr:hypothetical protein [Rhizobium sp. EC-SD404]VVT30012.1 conserved hypothetical protein [Rhizobium sp. EC-SD404]
MPSLIRFLVFCGVVVGLVYGAMLALVIFVEPNPREITVRVPTERINQPAGGAATGDTAPTIGQSD